MLNCNCYELVAFLYDGKDLTLDWEV